MRAGDAVPPEMDVDEPKTKVLLVDDHAMLVDLYERVLSDEADLEVVGRAGSVDEAVEVAATCQPDVVLMDFELPGGDGATAAARIKSTRPETMVVMVTASEDDRTLLRAIEAGVSGFVPKSQDLQELVGAIRAARAGEALISPAVLGRLLPQLRHRDEAPKASAITPREMDVLRLIVEGKSNQAIADDLFVSVHTVRNHVQSILTKLGVNSKLEAIAAATRTGLVQL